jgi:homoserine kinase type II
MAVYTSVSDSEFASIFLDFISAKGIIAGVENTNYLVQTKAYKCIFTIFEKRTNVAELPFFIGLLEHLADKITCPKPLKQGIIGGKHYCVFSFLAGSSIINPTANQCNQVGESLAKMHLAAMDFPLSRKNSMDFEQFNYQVEKIANAEISSYATSIQQDFAKGFDVPSGIIHGDLFPDNVFFNNGNLSGLIDFFFASNDYLIYDVAITLNAWCFDDNSFNLTKAKNFIRGYNSIRQITDNEKKVFALMCRKAALRFTLSRMYDSIYTQKDAVVKIKNPKEYMQKLRFHLATHTYEEYGF